MTAEAKALPSTSVASVTDGLTFDWWAVLVGAWILTGVYLDTWAHKHIVDELEDLFTPWHAVLYSGLLSAMALFGVRFVLHRLNPTRWPTLIPKGYELMLGGIAVFTIGGLGDMLWHNAFGLESGFAAGISPTHLIIGVAIMLTASGPFVAAWLRAHNRTLWPALIGLTLALGLFTIQHEYAHPFVPPSASVSYYPGPEQAQQDPVFSLAFAGLILQTAVLMGVLLACLRRWGSLPFGAFTLIIGLHLSLLTIASDEFRLIPVALLGGIIADVLAFWLKPTLARPAAFRWFALAVPTIFYTLYIFTLFITGGVWWEIHVWGGYIILAGLTGLMVSALVLPPAVPSERQ